MNSRSKHMGVPVGRPRYRRFLLDLHIPDWDERFLSRYKPRELIELYGKTGANSVMLYCQSHVGLCYWPSKSGKVHAACRGRDLLGEMVSLCRERDLETYAYYSGIFNNQAYLDHPSWRIEPSCARQGGPFVGNRYGHVCPNNQEYRAFVLSQVREIAESYPFDGVFFDMTFWPAVCLCPSCRERHRRETGGEIPEVVDWLSLEWCRFQNVESRPFEQRELQACAASSVGAAFRLIDAADPDGSVSPAVYNTIGRVFERLMPFEEFLGGEPLEEVAVYLSDHSKMSFLENGTAVSDPVIHSGRVPHLQAVRGAVRTLQLRKRVPGENRVRSTPGPRASGFDRPARLPEPPAGRRRLSRPAPAPTGERGHGPGYPDLRVRGATRGKRGGPQLGQHPQLPPWQHTDVPAIVENHFGRGRCIYSAADIEVSASPAHTALFEALLRRLLGGGLRFETDAHPAVWASVFRASGRYVISFLNYQQERPVVPIPNIRFCLRLLPGEKPGRAFAPPGRRRVHIRRAADGWLSATILMQPPPGPRHTPYS